jgi:ABC-type polysaccharide/polyol phosphate export permease
VCRGGLVVSLFFLFAGLFNPGPSIPAGYKWFYTANPIRYGLEALAAPQFAGSTTDITGLVNGVPQVVNVYTYLLEVYGLDAGQRFVDVGVLFVFMAASCALATVSLRYLNWIKR